MQPRVVPARAKARSSADGKHCCVDPIVVSRGARAYTSEITSCTTLHVSPHCTIANRRLVNSTRVLSRLAQRPSEVVAGRYQVQSQNARRGMDEGSPRSICPAPPCR